jgi:hypothetical protein
VDVVVITFDEESAHALEMARDLARSGIPVFVAYPNNSLLGFRLPDKWQTTAPEPRYVDAWRPGAALCAVMGYGLDLVDLDPRNGGDISSLDGAMPITYAVAASPSEGWHGYVKSLGVRSRDKVRPGIDIKAGVDGVGHGFAFLPPTERPSKVTGQIVAYRWVRPPNLAALAAAADDHSGEALAAIVRAAHGSTEPSATSTAPTYDIEFTTVSEPPWADLAATIDNNSRHDAVHKLASALRGRGGWRAEDALAYLRSWCSRYWTRTGAGTRTRTRS